MRSRLPGHRAQQRAQRGVVLVVTLIMLVLITLIVTTAYNVSTTNLRSVGNMQFRNEAIQAANRAIDQVIGTPFTTSPAASQVSVDMNNDGTNDYLVDVQKPTCLRAWNASGSAGASSLSLSLTGALWNTLWDIDATVTDQTTGASVEVREGVRVLLSDSQKQAACP